MSALGRVPIGLVTDRPTEEHDPAGTSPLAIGTVVGPGVIDVGSTRGHDLVGVSAQRRGCRPRIQSKPCFMAANRLSIEASNSVSVKMYGQSFSCTQASTGPAPQIPTQVSNFSTLTTTGFPPINRQGTHRHRSCPTPRPGRNCAGGNNVVAFSSNALRLKSQCGGM
jgi:hypothetical protein